MSDRYSQLVRLPVAGRVAKRVGLPQPVALERDGEFSGRVLLGGAGRAASDAARVLAGMGADAATALDDPVRAIVASAGLDAAVFNPLAPADQRFKALVFDATGAELVELHRFFHPTVRRVLSSGRVIVLGDGRRALEGFTRSLGKEIGCGATVNLVNVSEGARIDATLRFLLSPRSAYVSGQVIRVGPGEGAPLAGRRALVTGGARGIGAAIADAFEREGASVVRADLPDLDITAPDAPARLAEQFADGLDVLVHNAGITLDRTLAKMPEERWQKLMDVNLIAPERITEALLPVMRDRGRIVCVSSLSAIAGNAGQTNYATAKAGLLDLVDGLELPASATINAVAPGFIETAMTAAMPIGVREAGRRLNSLRQGGLPVDVAETVAWLASSGVDRNVVRVCGQSLLGREMFTTLKAVLPGRGDRMPDTVLEREVRVDRDALAGYAHVTGFTLRDELPPTYPHVLAFPLHLALLAHAPFSAVGVVHIANRISQHRRLRFGELLSLQVSVSELRPHRRGRVFDLLSSVRVGEELVWEDVSTNLKRGGGDDSVRDPWAFEDPPITAWWTLPDDLGRRYARVSGDHNPIHLHGWSAKPFGFPRAIAHGMWTKARCLSSLRLPDAFTADVRFKKPVLLPSKVKFGEEENRFAVLGHVEGVLSE